MGVLKLKSKADSSIGTFNHEIYYPSGQIMKQIISDSEFKTVKEFDEKGNLLTHIVYKGDLPYEIFESSNDDFAGILYKGDINKGNGTLIAKLRSPSTGNLFICEKFEIKASVPDGFYEKYTESGDLILKGQFNNGYMIGAWEKYDKSSHTLDTIINYALEDSIKNDTTNNLGVFIGEQYIIVEEMPMFLKKGLTDFRIYISKKLHYPELCAENGISGRIYVQFSVSSTGEVVDIKVVKGVNDELDNEAVRVVKCSPYWRPGMQHGIPVKVQFTFPIVFVLG